MDIKHLSRILLLLLINSIQCLSQARTIVVADSLLFEKKIAEFKIDNINNQDTLIYPFVKYCHYRPLSANRYTSTISEYIDSNMALHSDLLGNKSFLYNFCQDSIKQVLGSLKKAKELYGNYFLIFKEDLSIKECSGITTLKIGLEKNSDIYVMIQNNVNWKSNSFVNFKYLKSNILYLVLQCNH